MSWIGNRLDELGFRLRTGTKLEIIDEQIGEEVVIRYKDIYVSLLIGKESKEPQSISWSHDPTMYQTPIREILVVTPTKNKVGK